MKTLSFPRIAFLLVPIVFLFSCKKDSPIESLKKPDKVDGVTKEALLKDSVYYYTDYFYLWQDQLPSLGAFKPSIYKTAEEVLTALKSYAKDSNGKSLDRFSFLDRTGAVNESIQEGLSGSFGFDVRYNNENDLFVKQVYPGSPADVAGIKRGWKLLEINGNTKLDYGSFNADNFSFLNNALDVSSSISLKLKMEDGKISTVNLQRTSFQIHPILHQSIYTVGAKKVGYFVFESFVSTETSSNKDSYVKQELKQLFLNFENQGISELVVDLRYNGGGAVVTAEYLSNMLVPTVANGQLMYTYQINKELEADGWRDFFFTPVNFEKKNSLNLNRIYFLVTKGSTASASELLVNNLNPFVDIKLIGEEATYGKPVGFFGWPILGVDLYAVSFKTINNQGFGDYFGGMPVDKNVGDDVSKNWGDKEDSMLRQALYYAEKGAFTSVNPLQAGRKGAYSAEQNPALNRVLDRKGNHDMYDFRKKLKIPIRQ